MPARRPGIEESPFLRAVLHTKSVRIELPLYDPLVLDHNMTWEDLAEVLSEHFVPRVECYSKCPAMEICPFTVPDPARPGRLKEIVCGYQIQVIRNFLKFTLPVRKPRTPNEISALIASCLAAKEFLFGIFTTSAGVVHEDYVRWWNTSFLSSLFFCAGDAVRGAEEFSNSAKTLGLAFLLPLTLFVEGKSEKIVLGEALGRIRARDIEIFNLEGCTRQDFLRASLQGCKRQNREAALLLDRPSLKLRNSVEKLIGEGLLKRENAKFLSGDFEDVFTPETLEMVAKQSLKGPLLQACLAAIADAPARKKEGFSKCLRRKLLEAGISKDQLESGISTVKAKLARGIASLIHADYYGFVQAIAWRKDPRKTPQRFTEFVHLCRWILHTQGRDLRHSYLTSN